MNIRSATSNKPLTLSNIYRLLQTPFYYGQFEYPAGSGNWYTGKHEPLITRELYDKAQEYLKRDKITKGETKEFAFTRLITCGLCGSAVCAEEKFKYIKSTGLTARYIYYGCNRSKDRKCKGGYIREEDLIQQFIEQIDNIELDLKPIKQKFEEERLRAKKFQQQFFGVKKPEMPKVEFDPKQYATYVLTQGLLEEKRELLSNIKQKLTLKEKNLCLY